MPHLQVPLLATALLIGLSQLTAPAVSFMNDMRPHCLGLRRNPVVPFFIFIVCTVGIIWVLYPDGSGGDLLRQTSLPFRFRVELLIYMAACAIVLAILVNLQRRCILYHQASCRRKISTVMYVPMSSDGPEKSRPLGRKSFDGRDAVLRSTGSTDVGDWLRRTASAVGELSTILPGYRSNSKIAPEQLPV